MKHIFRRITEGIKLWVMGPDRKRCNVCGAGDIKVGCTRQVCPYPSAEDEEWHQMR